MSKILTIRYPSLERLQLSWNKRITDGKLFVPCNDPTPAGTPALLYIHVDDTPTPLELEGIIQDTHVVERNGQTIRGVELHLDLPGFVRTAVEAYLERDWRRAAPVISDDESFWMPFGPSTRSAHRFKFDPDTEPTIETRPLPPQSLVKPTTAPRTRGKNGWDTPTHWFDDFEGERTVEVPRPTKLDGDNDEQSGPFESEKTSRFGSAPSKPGDDAPIKLRRSGEFLPPRSTDNTPPRTRDHWERKAPDSVDEELEDHADDSVTVPGAFIFRKR